MPGPSNSKKKRKQQKKEGKKEKKTVIKPKESIRKMSQKTSWYNDTDEVKGWLAPASPLLYAGPGFFFEQLSLYIFRLFAYLYIEVRKQQNFIDIWVSVMVGKCSGACQAWIDINDVLRESRKPTTSLECSFFL